MSKTIQDAVIQEDGVWGKTNTEGREVNVMAWLTGSIDYLYLSRDGVLYHERGGHIALSRWQIICNQKEFQAEAQKMGYGSSRSMKGKYVMVRGLDAVTYHAIGKRLVELGYEGEYPDNQYFDDFQDDGEWVFGVNKYGSNYHGDKEGNAFYNGECLTPFQMLELLYTLSDPVKRGDYVFTRNIKTLSQFEAIVDKMIEAGGFRGFPCTFEDIKEYSNEQILMFDRRDGEIWVYPESDDTGAIRERSVESIILGVSEEKTPTESVGETPLKWPIDPSLVGRKVRFEGYNNSRHMHWMFTEGDIYTIDRRHNDGTVSVRDNEGTYPSFNYDNSFKFTLLPEDGEDDWHEDGKLPPVGTVCTISVYTDGYETDEFIECEVLMHSTVNGEDVAVVKGDIDGSEQIGSGVASRFKPIPEKTERDLWVQCVEQLVEYCEADVRSVAGAIYDADLAKVA